MRVSEETHQNNILGTGLNVEVEYKVRCRQEKPSPSNTNTEMKIYLADICQLRKKQEVGSAKQEVGSYLRNGAS